MSIKIICRTPSTGKPINILLSDVPTTYTTIAESPYYSIPDASLKYAVRDPAYPDNSRALREGEVFFVTPLSVRNKSTESKEISVRLVTEPQSSIEVSKIIEFSKIVVPAGDTALIPLQGRSLFKRDITPKINVISTFVSLSEQKDSAVLVKNNLNSIVTAMWSDLGSSTNPDTGTAWNYGWSTGMIPTSDEFKTKRDATFLIQAIYTVLSTAVERPILDFARALFDSAGVSYIQSEKKAAFIHSWDYINTQINDISGMSEDAQDIVTGLITALKSIVNASFHSLTITPGDVLQVKAESENTFDIWISGEQKPSNEHTGIVSITTT